MITWANEKRKLGDLKPWGRNPRQIKSDQAKRLSESFDEFGQVETIAIGPDNEVYNGHQRLNVLMAKHGKECEVEVRVSSRPLTEKEREKLTVYLHKGAAGEWNFDVLANEFELDELVEWGFAPEELGVHPGTPRGEDPGAQIDKAEELREKWGVEAGQLWQLGVHRLICGDCTDRSVIKRLMGEDRAEMIWTDPPYGVAIGDKNKFLNSIAPSNRVEENIDGDLLGEDDLADLLCKSFDAMIEHCLAGAGWYVAAPPGPLHIVFGSVLKDRGIWRQTIQWVKNNSTFSPLGVCYHWQAEPIFFGWLPNGAHRWYGGRTQTTVWEIDRPTKSPEHPTMKPVELVARAIENSSRPGEIVADPFCGSGTTLIACEQTERICRAAEISPAYVAVALERWSVLSGKAPELISGSI